jgi:hypothetical protein
MSFEYISLSHASGDAMTRKQFFEYLRIHVKEPVLHSDKSVSAMYYRRKPNLRSTCLTYGIAKCTTMGTVNLPPSSTYVPAAHTVTTVEGERSGGPTFISHDPSNNSL